MKIAVFLTLGVAALCSHASLPAYPLVRFPVIYVCIESYESFPVGGQKSLPFQ
jgi:hypothetical protein